MLHSLRWLQGVVAAIQSAGLVVDRFFSSTNYSPEESQVSSIRLYRTAFKHVAI
jgi:hypothetical protein